MKDLSPDQKRALDAIIAWYFNPNRSQEYITLGGYAGTGKTTLIARIREELAGKTEKLKVGFASYTGKAARVLQNSLKNTEAIHKQDTVGTIHSLIYSPIVNSKEEIVGWQRKEKLDRNLIIIDEASMVDAQIWKDLLSYRIPIIAVGDHGQLPPISGQFTLMQEPVLQLTHIHRQARENPIIGLSIAAREHGIIRPGRYSGTVIKYQKNSFEAQEMMEDLMRSSLQDTLVLCGYNHTRQKLNTHIRGIHEKFGEAPVTGDRVICLRNNHSKHIFNGMLGTIISISPHDAEWFYAEIAIDDTEEPYKGLVSVRQFGAKKALNFTSERSFILRGDIFDFGYALTVHKAQGSQAKRVVLFEERFAKMDDTQWKRWLYTAVTRAQEELYVFGG